MRIALIGDIGLGGIISSQPDKNSYRFKIVSDKLKKYDLVFANLETPVESETYLDIKGKILLSANKDVTKDVLRQLKVSCVSLANNHIFDGKMDGLRNTIGLLDNQGIAHTGAGWKKKHIDPVIIKNESVSIAFLAYVDINTNPGTESYSNLFINYLEPKKIIKDIQGLKNKVDKIILSLHWGKDYSHYPTNHQISLSDSFLDAGVDIIMGHHSHVLQPFIRKEDNRIVYYGLGSLVFGDFIHEGEMRALRLKTKKSVIPCIELNNMSVNYIHTKDTKGNEIKVIRGNYIAWSKRKLWLSKMAKSNYIFRLYIKLKETIFDRLIDVLFGYYRTPLMVFKSIKKINILIKDLKK